MLRYTLAFLVLLVADGPALGSCRELNEVEDAVLSVSALLFADGSALDSCRDLTEVEDVIISISFVSSSPLFESNGGEGGSET